jgi:hypothetical protein
MISCMALCLLVAQVDVLTERRPSGEVPVADDRAQ